VGVTTFETTGEDETAAAAERFAASLTAGDVVLLIGDLGAGKTAFVRGMARGLGIAPAEVTSPTFTLIQEYAGPHGVLHHVDLYRLAPVEVEELGLDELVSSGAIVAIEWPDRWRDRPAAHEVRIEHRGGDRRLIAISNPRSA
jgi:tRNA threonylcarbamoyladenosine biosynthesis protein TsaE